ICHLRAKRQSVNIVRIRLRAGEPTQEDRLPRLIPTRCMPWGNSSVRARNARSIGAVMLDPPWPGVLLYAGDFRVWRFPPFCMDSLRDNQLRVTGKVVEDVTGTSCKRVAANAQNSKGQKSCGVSHHGRPYDSARHSDSILHLTTSF